MSLIGWLVGGAAALALGLRLLPDDFDTRSGSLVDDVSGAPIAGATVVASWSQTIGSLARDGSGVALVPLQLALIAEMERFPSTKENVDMLTWAREGVAATRRAASAGDRSP